MQTSEGNWAKMIDQWSSKAKEKMKQQVQKVN